MTTTAFEPDVHAALQRAQQETFARGEYGFTYTMTRLYRAMGKQPPPLPPQKKARSIDEARTIGDADGTCSVLDIYEIGPEPAPGVAGPIALEMSKPTKEDLESALSSLYERLGRGEAAYLICYESDEPVAYWFIGMSFD
jgi:hypothetical protein